jgi:hypothetical protein
MNTFASLSAGTDTIHPAHINLNLLADLFAGLYPTEPDTRRILTVAGIDAERIQFTGKAVTTWHFAIREAHYQTKTLDLIAAALREYPTNRWLTSAHATLTPGA